LTAVVVVVETEDVAVVVVVDLLVVNNHFHRLIQLASNHHNLVAFETSVDSLLDHDDDLLVSIVVDMMAQPFEHSAQMAVHSNLNASYATMNSYKDCFRHSILDYSFLNQLS
jgi:hypothetical protein